MTSSVAPAANSIFARHSLTAATTYWPVRGAPPHAAGKRQWSSDPSGTRIVTGAIFPSLHGTSQNSWFVSAIVMCAIVLGSVEFWSLRICGLDPAKSTASVSARFVIVHTTWNGSAVRVRSPTALA